MIKNTSTEHFDKYEQLMDKLKICPHQLAISLFGLYPRWKLRKLFAEDEHLNNIPLGTLDWYTNNFLIMPGNPHRMSLSDGVCVIKHCLIYYVIGADPLFEREVTSNDLVRTTNENPD